MWTFSNNRRGKRGFTRRGEGNRPEWGHPQRHEADWPARRNRELVELLALTAPR